MERLTKRNKKGYLLFKEKIVYAGDFYEMASALEKYEDTGLTPEEIMGGKMLTEWIPVEERLPQIYTRVLATIKHHKWISDYDSDWVPEEEKTVYPDYTESCEAIYLGDIGWEYLECISDNEYSSDFVLMKPEMNIAEPIVEVLAWMPLPEPYKEMISNEMS